MSVGKLFENIPSGMQMPGRKYSPSSGSGLYRYGFNGKENDNDVKGEGNQQDYGMRIYDPRLGKFLSVDPISTEYPWNSVYAFAENGPISNIDLDGLERKNSIFGDIATGFRKGANEFTSKVKTTSKAIFKTQTYKDALNGVVDYAKTAINDPSKAVKKFSDGAYNLSMGFSNTIQQYTTQPILWTLTISQRAKEENLQALGYGLWKSVELYVLTRAPVALESGEADAIFGRLNSARVSASEGNKIISDALSGGGRLVIVSEEEPAVMKAVGGQAGIRWYGNGVADLRIQKGASRATIMEEAIHYRQYVKHGEEHMFDYGNYLRLEIEAQDELLRIGANEKWSKAELNQIKTAKSKWEKALEAHNKKKK